MQNVFTGFLLVVSLLVLVSCNGSHPNSVQIQDNLQSDGYGDIDDSIIYQIPDDEDDNQTSCEDKKKDVKELVCPDGKTVYLCHYPKGNPLNAHLIKVNIHSAKSHLKEHDDYPVRCRKDYYSNQNCPYIDCSDDDNEEEEAP